MYLKESGKEEFEPELLEAVVTYIQVIKIPLIK